MNEHDDTAPVRLRRLTPGSLEILRREPFDDATLEIAAGVVRDVRDGGWPAVLALAARFGDVAPGAEERSIIVRRDALTAALESLPDASRNALERCAGRIRAFANAQRACLTDLDREVLAAGGVAGRAGHRFIPVTRAGCYAPGGRFPLPSSVLMTVIAARAAGVAEVWVASPRPTAVTLAAAAIAGADALLAIGGVQAIAAMAYGAGPVPACDTIVGPGNKYVTAAKHLVSRRVGIDMLAGPSELLVIADDSADPALIAADLLAQAEHDADAGPMLVTTDARLVERVEDALERGLTNLPTATIARAALRNGFAVIAASIDDAIRLSDRIAPEHLEVMTRDAASVSHRLSQYGALFIGSRSAEVLGDYGAGPNHVLPTGGSARSASGLWVGTFLHARTWMEASADSAAAQLLADDTATVARLEGLEAHARAAEARGRP